MAALALAVVSLGVGIVGWFHWQPHDKPSPAPSAPTFTSQQISDAKENVCAAHRIVRQAAVLNTNQANPVPGDPTGDLAVAANARLALYSGGDSLLRRLTAEPATPAELRDAVRSLANALQELAVNYLAGAPDSVVTPLRLALERDTRAVDPLCV
ncbi:alanine and proline rich membrane protein [Mycobacterium tuberculosis]|nr:alanine and proline rich membrane protein [Mycobacterium tuberculosis]